MGAAGDMLTAALLELLPDQEVFLEKLNALGLPGVAYHAVRSVKNGIVGTHMEVTVRGESEKPSEELPSAKEGSESGRHHGHTAAHHHHGEHRSLANIEEIINMLPVSDRVKKDAKDVYGTIADAEAQVHGETKESVHFHEVGMYDAIADIVAVCMLFEELNVEHTAASPICTGFGQIRCAHGILPVPAPATACLLKGIPAYAGNIRGELCTPTGAALIKHFVGEFGTMPVMAADKIGYGMGTKEFEAANCVRTILGDGSPKSCANVSEITCNLDDMTAEEISYATNVLFEAGALDVFTEAVGMKKSRPGTKLTCLCRYESEEEISSLILKNTITLGVRAHTCRRYTLERESVAMETPYGTVHVKHAKGCGIERSKIEYEDIARIARENGIPFREAKETAEKSFRQ